MNSIEETIRKIVGEEIDKRDRIVNLTDIDTFCREKGVSRVTLWRQRKAGQLKTINIGSRIFIDMNQFTGK